jgi:hypothetical protein
MAFQSLLLSKMKSSRLLKKWLFLRLLKNDPAFVLQGGTTRRQADAS